MTDEAKALVERMGLTLGEWLVDEAPNDWWEYQRDHMKARDLIETQAREIERLRTAGDQMLTAFAEGTNWTAEKRAAYEAMNAVLAETLVSKIELFRSMLIDNDFDFGEAVEEFLSAVEPALRQYKEARDAS